MKNTAPYIFLFFLLCICSSCQKTTDSDTVKDTKIAVPNSVATDANGHSWMEDFKDFRTAVYQNNRAEQKKHFRFPITDPEIWFLCQLTPAEQNKRKSTVKNPDYFYEADFDHCAAKLFPKSFVNCIQKIKTKELFEEGHYDTPEFDDAEGKYLMYATVDTTTEELVLNQSFLNGEDEDGNYVSEGEYNIIYIFSISGDKLMLKRITMAG